MQKSIYYIFLHQLNCAHLFSSVAAGMVAINEAVDKADSADLLLSLKSKAVSLRSITPECADNYHVELKEAKTKKDDVGECNCFFRFSFQSKPRLLIYHCFLLEQVF